MILLCRRLLRQELIGEIIFRIPYWKIDCTRFRFFVFRSIFLTNLILFKTTLMLKFLILAETDDIGYFDEIQEQYEVALKREKLFFELAFNPPTDHKKMREEFKILGTYPINDKIRKQKANISFLKNRGIDFAKDALLNLQEEYTEFNQVTEKQ